MSDQLIDDADLFIDKHVDGFGLHLKACILIGRV